MSGTPVYINVQQLMIDRGRLGFGAGATVAPDAAVNTDQMAGAVKALLDELKSPEVIVTLADAPHIRIRLTAVAIQWLEKTDTQVNKYEFQLSGGKLTFNGNATDPTFKQAFGGKIDRLLAAITAKQFQIYTKEGSK